MLYKTLTSDGRSCNGGDSHWSLPVRNADGTWTPGDWMPAITGELIPCQNGYHLAEDAQVMNWLNERLFEAEYRGEALTQDDKVVVREARLLRELNWNDRTARLFAVWCARQAMKLIENPDPRSLAAIDTAEKYAHGHATSAELAAARDAAWAAARDAAWAAAWAAARDAAWDAARDAAWDAARDAAWDAARAAAWAAARAAAWAAARAAAWAAARAAARDAQYKHLVILLEA